jgi:CheY-like chemotaxis protein
MLSTTVLGSGGQAPFAPLPAHEEQPARRCATGNTILLVEDVEATRTGLAELLRMRGHVVKEAADGEEGLRLLRETPEVCAVVLDLRMPSMDGYAFRRQQLDEPEIGHVPVIVFTATPDAARIREELKVDEVLTKPLGVGELLDAVARMCPQGS